MISEEAAAKMLEAMTWDDNEDIAGAADDAVAHCSPHADEGTEVHSELRSELDSNDISCDSSLADTGCEHPTAVKDRRSCRREGAGATSVSGDAYVAFTAGLLERWASDVVSQTVDKEGPKDIPESLNDRGV